jgi:hypothetical protein
MQGRRVALILLPLLLAACNFPAAGLPGPQISLATATASPSATITPTPSSTPTATPTPLNPLTIQYLREHDYPASELTIEETLDVGPNYFRYIASYQSLCV